MSEFKIQNLKVEIEKKVVVDSVSLSVSSGEVHILMGLNGSGKSSLLNAVAGHPDYKIFNGDVFIDDKNITNLKIEEKAKLGLFFSMQHVPEIAGVTMISFLHRASNILKNEDVSIFDFYKKIEKKADDLNIDSSLLKRELNVGFSGGEKKQAELLQLVALEPKFAILDEIDSGVDADASVKIFSGIKKLSEQGTGFILVTHYNTILNHIIPDFVHIMNEGKVIYSGGAELVSEITKNGFNAIIDG